MKDTGRPRPPLLCVDLDSRRSLWTPLETLRVPPRPLPPGPLRRASRIVNETCSSLFVVDQTRRIVPSIQFSGKNEGRHWASRLIHLNWTHSKRMEVERLCVLGNVCQKIWQKKSKLCADSYPEEGGVWTTAVLISFFFFKFQLIKLYALVPMEVKMSIISVS